MTDINPFTQGTTLWNEHQDFIQSKARSIARSFWNAEEADVLQEIHLFLWQNEAKLLEGGFSEGYIRTSIANVAVNYAKRQRDAVLLKTDKFYYSVDEIKELLPYYFQGDWATSPVPDGAVSLTKNDNVEIMCDFSMTFDRLSVPFQEILVRKYGDGEELSEARDRQQASRAVKKFHLMLNTETDKRAKAHQGPGSRKAISSSNGVYQAKAGYEE